MRGEHVSGCNVKRDSYPQVRVQESPASLIGLFPDISAALWQHNLHLPVQPIGARSMNKICSESSCIHLETIHEVHAQSDDAQSDDILCKRWKDIMAKLLELDGYIVGADNEEHRIGEYMPQCFAQLPSLLITAEATYEDALRQAKIARTFATDYEEISVPPGLHFYRCVIGEKHSA